MGIKEDIIRSRLASKAQSLIASVKQAKQLGALANSLSSDVTENDAILTQADKDTLTAVINGAKAVVAEADKQVLTLPVL